MCGRYALRSSMPRIARMLGVEAPEGTPPRYNIAPTQQVPVCRELRDAPRELRSMRWGLVPSWSRDARGEYRMINARAETLARRAAFRAPFRHRRCLVPADGFYEWRSVAGRKQPCFITMRDGAPFAFAGLWERREDGAGGPLESCTIITTSANELLAPLHARMPVILAPADYDRWLDPGLTDTAGLEPLLRPCPPARMTWYPVSTRVNSPRNDDEQCVAPLPGAGAERA